MNHAALQTVSLALILGVASYALSLRLRIPATLFYIGCGVAAGPAGFHILRVDSLGTGLRTFVEIAVAIILFEGGLSLSSRSFQLESSPISRILGFSIPLTGLGATILGHAFLGLRWDLAAFFGALIVVTGPTAVGSLLKNVNLRRRVEVLLHWESIWGDVIGVLISALALEIILVVAGESLGHLGGILALRVLDGILIGLASGFILARVVFPWAAKLKEPGFPGILAVGGALATFDAANLLVEASGPLAVAVSGFSLSHLKAETIHEIRRFKEQLSSLFIGTLFVMLSSAINPLQLVHRWPMMLLVAFLLGALVRPASVLLALWRTPVPLGERLYVGIIGPRGIIALAVASYAALQVQGREQEMAILLNLIFAIIFLSGAAATFLCRPLAALFKVEVPESGTGLLLVGVNPLSSALASFAGRHVPVAFVDTSRDTCVLAESMGHQTVCADILDIDVYEDAREQGFNRLLAVTASDAMNRLVTEAAAVHLGPDMVFRARGRTEDESVATAPLSPTGLAFSPDFSVPEAVEMLEQGRARLQLLPAEDALAGEVVPLLEIVDDGRGVRILGPGDVPRSQCVCFVPVK